VSTVKSQPSIQNPKKIQKLSEKFNILSNITKNPTLKPNRKLSGGLASQNCTAPDNSRQKFKKFSEIQ